MKKTTALTGLFLLASLVACESTPKLWTDIHVHRESRRASLWAEGHRVPLTFTEITNRGKSEEKFSFEHEGWKFVFVTRSKTLHYTRPGGVQKRAKTIFGTEEKETVEYDLRE